MSHPRPRAPRGRDVPCGGPGATVQAQFWFRDQLSTSNQTTALSDALEFTLCP